MHRLRVALLIFTLPLTLSWMDAVAGALYAMVLLTAGEKQGPSLQLSDHM